MGDLDDKLSSIREQKRFRGQWISLPEWVARHLERLQISRVDIRENPRSVLEIGLVPVDVGVGPAVPHLQRQELEGVELSEKGIGFIVATGRHCGTSGQKDQHEGQKLHLSPPVSNRQNTLVFHGRSGNSKRNI